MTGGTGGEAREQGPFGRHPHPPGNLTAVPHADQSLRRQDAPERPGSPRPAQVRPKPLAELAERLGTPAPAAGAPVTGITHDSRAVRPGDLYAALPGARVHGADFVTQAAGLGAIAVLTDRTGAERAAATSLPVLVVDDPRAPMGELAATIDGPPGPDRL